MNDRYFGVGQSIALHASILDEYGEADVEFRIGMTSKKFLVPKALRSR